ncbi:MAG: LytTR family DNA-binding domain-containing protein [Bacteroidota bacterium]
MKALIIEDEQLAAERLELLIKNYDHSIEIIDKIDSVKNAVKWFANNPHPDVVFLDIQLADGVSFEIFEMTKVNAPIIFTTAYDEYALKAFKVNSVDYLLKPIDDDELKAAFDKLNQLSNGFGQAESQDKIEKVMSLLAPKHKNRFIVKVGEHIKSIPVQEILFFFSREKASFMNVNEGKNYLLDYSLEQIESMVDPGRYFRINRKYMITLEAVLDIVSYSNSRLKVTLKHSQDNDIIVSRDRVADFKHWLDQ